MRFRTIVIAILIGLILLAIGFLIGRDAVPTEIIGERHTMKYHNTRLTKDKASDILNREGGQLHGV